MSVLVVAEHDDKTLSAATARAVSAALQLGGDVQVLVACAEGAEALAAQAGALSGVAKVLLSQAPHYASMLAEEIAPLITHVASRYSHILMSATTTGKDILPRAAALLDMGMLSDVIAIVSSDTFRRPIYAGNAIETVQSMDAITLLTIRATAFNAAGAQTAAGVEPLAALPPSGLSSLVGKEMVATGRPDLATARVVISGGRGLGSAENFTLLERIADRLGAAIGASRAAVDAGYVPNDYQVGQTGKVVAPELYIAVGISGAIQHIAGMKDSRVIVAINKDEGAPIFEYADYGLAADLFTVLPELEKALS